MVSSVISTLNYCDTPLTIGGHKHAGDTSAYGFDDASICSRIGGSTTLKALFFLLSI